jgi:hypothetical protein
MNMYLMRLVCYMDSAGLCNMEVPGDAVQLAQGHCADIEANRVAEDTRLNAAVEGEELVVDDAGERCLKVAVVVGGAEVEDPAARGGDDATSSPPCAPSGWLWW